jgi:hypothetical protein
VSTSVSDLRAFAESEQKSTGSVKMADMRFTSRPTLFALGVAIATIAAPAAAAFAGSPPTVAPRVLAGCTNSSQPYSADLDCEPNSVADFGGAPSEMQLTESNPGIASPESPEHGR